MAIFNILKQNRYRVKITDSDWPVEWTDLFQKQISKVEVSLTEKTITLWVRQSNVSPNVMDIIAHLLSDDEEKKLIENIHLSPLGNSAFELNFVNGEVSEHDVVFDYMKKDDLIHRVKFTFPKVKMINSTKNLLTIGD